MISTSIIEICVEQSSNLKGSRDDVFFYAAKYKAKCSNAKISFKRLLLFIRRQLFSNNFPKKYMFVLKHQPLLTTV